MGMRIPVVSYGREVATVPPTMPGLAVTLAQGLANGCGVGSSGIGIKPFRDELDVCAQNVFPFWVSE